MGWEFGRFEKDSVETMVLRSWGPTIQLRIWDWTMQADTRVSAIGAAKMNWEQTPRDVPNVGVLLAVSLFMLKNWSQEVNKMFVPGKKSPPVCICICIWLYMYCICITVFNSKSLCIVANMLDYDIVVRVWTSLTLLFTFWLIPLEKAWTPYFFFYLPLSSYGLNSTAAFLQGWFWH